MNPFSTTFHRVISPFSSLRPIRIHQGTLPSIQLLRALAAILVLLFHVYMILQDSGDARFFSLFKAGFAGVDVFFVVSGFIIAHTNLVNIHHPSQLSGYLLKRGIRIFPVYWIGILLMLTAIPVLDRFAPSLRIGAYSYAYPDILATSLVLPFHESALSVSWTLSYEVYFYLIFGLIILSRWLLILPFVILSGTLLNGYWWLTAQPAFPNLLLDQFLFSAYNLEFASGVLICLCTRYTNWHLPWIGLWVAVVIYFAAGEVYNAGDASWSRIPTFGLAAFLIVLTLVTREGYSRMRIPSWLLELGEASYILYLIHVPILVFFNRLIRRLGGGEYIEYFDFLLVVLICWLSLLIHRWWEKPLLLWARSLGSGQRTRNKPCLHKA